MRYVVLGYKDRIVEVKRGPIPSSTYDSSALTMFPGTSLWSSGTGMGRGNVFERIELGDDRVAFKTIVPDPDTGHYEYIQADHDAGVVGAGNLGVAGMPTGLLRVLPIDLPGERETFREIWLDDTYVALETWRQLFVTAEGDGNGSALTINRDVIGEWQRFFYLVPPEGLLPPEEPKPTIAEQATGTVGQAQTKVSGIPESPVGTVQDARQEVLRPARLRDKIFRRPGE